MGSGESKTEKTVDTSGTVNNNVVVTADLTMEKTQILLLFLCILKTMEFLYFVYVSHQRKLKKKYGAKPGNGHPPPA